MSPSAVVGRLTDEIREIIRADIRRMIGLHIDRAVTDAEVEEIMRRALSQYQAGIKGNDIRIDGKLFFVTIDPEKYILHAYGEDSRRNARPSRTGSAYGRRVKEEDDE